MTHRRLAEAHLLWHQALDRYHETDSFLANLNAAIEALRNITFVLQNEKTVPDFKAWYEKWQTILRADANAQWLHDARTTVVHKGELESHSSAEIRLITWQDRILKSVPVPAETPSALILQSLPLLDLAAQSGAPKDDIDDAAIAIERRWSAKGLEGREILDVLARTYGLLSDMVLEAHTLIANVKCIPATEVHPDLRSPYHRTGTLECMVAGIDQRTQRFKLSTLDELITNVRSGQVSGFPMDESDRYGVDNDGRIAPWQTSDLGTLAANILYRAKRVLSKDRVHHRMMFIRDGQGRWHNATLFARDHTDKHLLMREAALFVERKGCDALIEVGEVWIERPSPSWTGISAVPNPEKRIEALFVGVWAREGFKKSFLTPFTRGPFGGIKLRETQECDDRVMLYLEPILAVWRKQGFRAFPDGSTSIRIWEPDPLDVCFCGGPRRFAECCKELIDRNAADQVTHTTNAEPPSLAEIEKRARAKLAQYVIWVRQHTVPTMNSPKGLYKDLAELDVQALESLIHELRKAEDANGTDDGFVAQLRHLAEIIGIPRISQRMTALAADWLFRAGRTEEGILELDHLGDLRKVDDSLALILAAKFCEHDDRKREDTLRRAASKAIVKDEARAARLGLAAVLFERNAKNEALRIVDSVIGEADVEKTTSLLAEARMLRWKITKAGDDFELAMVALSQDPVAGRHAIDLIDGGKYDEAESLLAAAIASGDLVAKMLIIDGRLRSGKLNMARDLFLTIDGQIPPQLQCPYGVTAALVAMFLRDEAIRDVALNTLRGLPVAAVESNSVIRSYLNALGDKEWNKLTS